MKKYFPFLAFVIFFFFLGNETKSQTQNPLTDSLPEKVEPRFILNPNLSFSSFVSLLKARTAQDDTRIIDIGIRSTFYLQKPDFVFCT